MKRLLIAQVIWVYSSSDPIQNCKQKRFRNKCC